MRRSIENVQNTAEPAVVTIQISGSAQLGKAKHHPYCDKFPNEQAKETAITALLTQGLHRRQRKVEQAAETRQINPGLSSGV